MVKQILLILLLLSSTSCSLFGINPKSEKISFKPTQCSNPWDVREPNQSPEESFKAYLLENGISEIFDFKVTTDNGVYCEACICPGAQTYHFKIYKNELEKLRTIKPFDEILD